MRNEVLRMTKLREIWLDSRHTRGAGVTTDLGGNTHWAGVGVALPHHDAAQGDEGGGGEAELLSSQQGGHGNVPAGAHLAICLQGGPPPQVIGHQGLMSFCQAQLPRQTCSGVAGCSTAHTCLQGKPVMTLVAALHPSPCRLIVRRDAGSSTANKLL